MDCRSFSIEQLLRLSYQYGLVTDYRITPTEVRLFRDEEEILSGDPEEARIYLQGLVTGRSFALERGGGVEGDELTRGPSEGRIEA